MEGQIVVDFEKKKKDGNGCGDIYFNKRKKHRVTYKSGQRCTLVQPERDCRLKVVAGENVASDGDL